MTEAVKSSVNKLITDRRKRDPLPAAAPAAPIPEAVGRASPQAASQATGTGGMAWPLTETAYERRDLYAEETLFSSDGIFSWTRSRVKSLEMKDANGTTGQIQLKQPAT